jgi:DNA polymerase-3 subunit beta
VRATVNKVELLKAIQTAERAVNTKSSLPILSALMLTVEGAVLTVRATDLEVGIVATCLTLAREPGAAAVPGKQLVEFVRSLPGHDVTLTLADNKLEVMGGKSKFKLAVIGGQEEFPVLPKVEPTASFCIPESELKADLERVTIAASAEDTRPILQSLLWETDEAGETLTLTATDTHRLHVATTPINSAIGNLKVLVGARACGELIRLLNGADDASVSVDANQIEVKTHAGTLTARLTEGQFPNVAKVIPTYSGGVTLQRDDLAEVINRTGLVAKEACNRIFLTFADGQHLNITASAMDLGECEEEMETLGEVGGAADKKLAANCKFLVQAVQACPDEEVQFLHTAAGRPLLIHGKDKSRFLAVVMPMSFS